MGDLPKALTLIKEALRVWDAGQLDDALTLCKAAIEADPDLPDPWLYIGEINRQKDDDESLLQALEADRKLVDLGTGVDSLIIDVTLAQGRIDREQERFREAEAQRVAAQDEANRRYAAQVENLRAEERAEAARMREYREAEERSIAAAQEFRAEETHYDIELVPRWSAITQSSAPTWQVMREVGYAMAAGHSGEGDRAWTEAIGQARRRIRRRDEAKLIQLWQELLLSANKIAALKQECDKAEESRAFLKSRLGSRSPVHGVPPPPPSPPTERT